MRHLVPLSTLTLGMALLGGASDAADGPAPKRPDPAAMFRFGDANKDGKLSRDEFQKLVARNPRLKDNPDAARQLFTRLDADGDGFLTLGEFRKIVGMQQGNRPPQAPKPDAAPAKSAAVFSDSPTAEQVAFFEKKIRPALADHCYKCHSADAEKLKGGLSLDTRDGTRAGGDSGPAVVPGSPDRSPLIKAVRYKDEDARMPPKQKLPDAVIADFESWVRMGAPDPRQSNAPAAKTNHITAADIEKGREHWAFQSPKDRPAPAVKDAAWAKCDTDRHLLAKLEAEGLDAGAGRRPADARPAHHVRPDRPAADARRGGGVRGRRLARGVREAGRPACSPRRRSASAGAGTGSTWPASPRSSGKTSNVNFPHAWRYRDYVIAAFNADKPFDQFIREQLAGDLMPADDPKKKAERAIATGFLALGPKALNERNTLQFQMDVVDEQIDATSQAFLGITAACARCHDHKFDPIPQKDYYALAGIFRSTETSTAPSAPSRPGGPPRSIHAAGRERPAPRSSRSGAASESDSKTQLEAVQKEQPGTDVGQARDPVRPDVAAPRPARISTRRTGRPSSWRWACVRTSARRTARFTSAARSTNRASWCLAACRASGRPQGPFGRLRQRPEGTGRVDRVEGQPAHRPRDGQPRLAAPVRPRAGAHAGQLRLRRPAAGAPGTARPPRGRVHGRRLVGEETGPPVGAEPRLPARLESRRRRTSRPTRTTRWCGG